MLICWAYWMSTGGGSCFGYFPVTIIGEAMIKILNNLHVVNMLSVPSCSNALFLKRFLPLAMESTVTFGIIEGIGAGRRFRHTGRGVGNDE